MQDRHARSRFLTAERFSRDEVFAKPSPVPKSPGVYGWWFAQIPGPIDVAGCQRHNGLTLLYTGISPSRPPTNGKPPSRQNIYQRIRYHYNGNAELSTLRKTLGILLSSDLGIELRRVGSGNRRTFGPSGEPALSFWMAENAFVSWIEQDDPWLLEDELISNLDVPLNLRGNAHNRFYLELKRLRAAAEQRARDHPAV